jgi:hypothetical protein
VKVRKIRQETCEIDRRSESKGGVERPKEEDRVGVMARPGIKISAKFRPNFAKFGYFGGGRKKTPKFCNTLIHVMYNSRLVFFY